MTYCRSALREFFSNLPRAIVTFKYNNTGLSGLNVLVSHSRDLRIADGLKISVVLRFIRDLRFVGGLNISVVLRKKHRVLVSTNAAGLLSQYSLDDNPSIHLTISHILLVNSPSIQ